MKLEDVLTLARAGYTAEQISALASAAAPAAAPAVQLTGRPEAIPAAAYLPETAAAADPIATLTGKLDALTAAIQANGLANAKQPALQTPDDIIASIIAPPITDGNKQ